jgi:hypothetical protein
LVLLFNFYGYRLVFDCMQNHEDALLSAKLDKEQYEEAELISIKTPLHLPYYSSSPEFERAYGSVEVKGMEYRYVKRRVFHDTLELLCLPDAGKMKIRSAQNEFSKTAADGNATNPSKKQASPLKVPLPDYCQQFTASNNKVNTREKQNFPSFNVPVHSVNYALVPEHPPCNGCC